MAYAHPEEQAQAVRRWYNEKKEKNKLRKMGYSDEEIEVMFQTLKNKKWRMTHLYKIRNKEGKLIVFKPNRAQKDFMERAGNRNIILKSRQLGFTTYETIDNLDEVLFNENFLALMIFHKKEAAEDAFFNKITLAWENIPEAIRNKFSVDKERTGEMRFKHAEGVYSAILCRTSGMSGTYSRVHVSELAPLYQEYPGKASKIQTETFPAVPDNGRIDIESTARGNDGVYYDIYQEALKAQVDKNVKSPWKPFFYNWTFDDMEINNIYKKDIIQSKDLPVELQKYQKEHDLTDLQMTYYYKKILDKGTRFDKAWKIIKQEYPTTIEEAFEGSDDKLFDPEVINLHRKEHAMYPEAEVNNWKYFKSYKPNHAYAIGVDVAEGIGEDSSAITVIDFTNKDKSEVVATYSNNKIGPDLLAYEIRNIAREYGNPLVAVERNNHGHATLAILKNIYRNIYKYIRTDKFTNEETEMLGWKTDSSSKPLMFHDLSTAMDDEQLIVPDHDLLDEMQSYSKSKINKIKANINETNHWDLLTSAAICYQMKTYAKPTKKVARSINTNTDFDKFAAI